jgi:hypothetical protein
MRVATGYLLHMNTRRSFTAICLAFVLVLTGQSMAVARGAAPAVGQMVLCIGNGSVVVYMDESGAPTAAPHVCPDCTLTMVEPRAAERILLAGSLSVWDAPQLVAQMIYVQPRVLTYLSRAPPVPV